MVSKEARTKLLTGGIMAIDRLPDNTSTSEHSKGTGGNVGAPPCGGNQFCNSLIDEDRAALCAICSRRSFSKNAEVKGSLFPDNVLMVLSGIMGTVKSTTGKLQYIYTPCNIFAHEYLFNSEIVEWPDYGVIRALRSLEVALFPATELRKLFRKRPTIAEALYRNLSTLYNEKCFYRLMVEMDDAYHAVHYMLLYLQEHGIEPPPTHEELAFMTGLNRVTVSRALKDIYRNETASNLSEYMHDGLLRE